jgi:hypothetical protein
MRVSLLGCVAPCSSMAFALLTGCGGPPLQYPASTPDARVSGHTGLQRSWVLRDAISENLLYVSNYSNVVMFSYPSGEVVGQLDGFDSNAGLSAGAKGDVFATNFNPPALYEYAHGGTKRIATYNLKQHGAMGCSFDSSTDTLAVIGIGSTVDLFAKGAKKPTTVLNSTLFYNGGCAYDASGNLYVDGSESSRGPAALAVLAKGSNGFATVSLGARFDSESNTQWDGNYLDLVAYNEKDLLRFSISGEKAFLAGKVHLRQTYQIIDFVLDDGALILSNWGYRKHLEHRRVLFYHYPAGGAPTFSLGTDLANPRGVAVSPAR